MNATVAAAPLLAALMAHPAEAGATIARPSPPCAACVLWQVDGRSLPVAAGLARGDLRGVRLLVDLTAVDDGAGAVASAMDTLQAAGAEIAVLVPAAATAGPWLPALAERASAVALAWPHAAEEQTAAHEIRQAATRVRAMRDGVAVGVDGIDPARLTALGLDAYADFLIAESAPQLPAVPPPSAVPRWWRTGAAPVTAWEVLALSRGHAGDVVIAWDGRDAALPRALGQLAAILPRDLASDPAAAECRMTDATAVVACDSAAFIDPATLDRVVIAMGGPDRVLRLAGPPQRVDAVPLAGDMAPTPRPLPAAVTAGLSATTLDLAAFPGPHVFRIVSGGEGRFATGVDVVAERPLTAAEIVARHQAAAARQAWRAPRWTAAGTSVVTFQAPGLSAPLTLTADTRLFATGAVMEIEQRDIRLNGARVRVGADGVPALPLIDAERPSSPPLALSRAEDYDYRLAPPDSIGGERCHVVAFAPRAARGRLARGRAWISSRDYGLVRLEAVLTGLRAPIVSSRQVDVFRPVPDARGGRAWLLEESRIEQAYEAPGHRTPVLRVVSLARHEIDPADFALRRAAAHAGSAVMLRDVGEGLVYLRRAPPRTEAPGAADSPPAAVRAPAPRRTRVRTLALGALVDPNIDRPLPFAGLGWADLDFLGSGTQIDGFLAGPFLRVAWSEPSLRGGRTQLQATGFASLVEYNDRVFRDGTERYKENLRQRPAWLSIGLMRPAGARTRLRASYELGWLSLRRADTTSPAFAAPPSALTHGLRIAAERDARGFTLAAWSHFALRDRWAAWGLRDEKAGAADAPRRGYFRAGATVTRPLVLHARVSGRVEAQILGGHHLDRFSRFGFDGLDERLRGYPSAALRFDRGAVLRSAWTWAAAPAVRLGAYADAAYVREPDDANGSRRHTGFGASADLPLPWHGHLTVDWGYGPDAPDREGRRGAHVVRLTAYTLF